MILTLNSYQFVGFGDFRLPQHLIVNGHSKTLKFHKLGKTRPNMVNPETELRKTRDTMR